MILLEEATRDDLLKALSKVCSSVVIAISYVEEDNDLGYSLYHQGSYVERVGLLNILSGSVEKAAPSESVDYFMEEEEEDGE